MILTGARRMERAMLTRRGATVGDNFTASNRVMEVRVRIVRVGFRNRNRVRLTQL